MTGVGSVTVLVPLPVLVSAPLWTSLKVAAAAVVKTKSMLLPTWVSAKDPAPSEFRNPEVFRLMAALLKPLTPPLAVAIVQM